MATIRGVIFDVDGTLVDSNDAHAHAWVDALKEAGHDVPFEKVRVLIGMGGDKLLPEVAGIEKETPEGKRIGERRGEIFATQYLPRLAGFPETEALLQRMHDSNLKLAVASSAEAHELDPLLEKAGAGAFIEKRTSSSDAKNSKPDPDIVQAALTSLGLKPDEVVMIGDTPYDLEAATKAGVKLIGVRCGGWSDLDLAGALAVYDSPADLLAKFDDSPFAPGPVGG